MKQITNILFCNDSSIIANIIKYITYNINVKSIKLYNNVFIISLAKDKVLIPKRF